MSTLIKGAKVGAFTIQFFIKTGSYAETYRVKDSNGSTCFMKLFNYAKLHRTQFDSEGNILEIEIAKQLNHPNITKYRDNGDYIYENQKFAFVIYDFISGETLAERLIREKTLSVYDVKQIILGVLTGLEYLHNLSIPVIHNEITIQNIMLDLSKENPVPKIIDFGYARYFNQSNKSFMKEGLNPFYLAPENFNGVFSAQSDLYSVGAVMYHLLFGLPPWQIEISKFKTDRNLMEDEILKERKKPLKLPNLNEEMTFELNSNVITTIEKALSYSVENRIKTATEFKKAINDEIVFETKQEKAESQLPPKEKFVSQKKGTGFNMIAGMQKLKDTLYNDVIRALNEKELYEEYGVGIPNGMLLYGPPGCGKTFIAEKFSEEISFNFIAVKPSDLASIYVHGQQEKIGNLFKEAKEKAPTIIFIDELDALMPSRDGNLSHSYAESVNEFLAQMTNCSKDGIFIIGATNRPDKIDTAILRTGRMDRVIYIPPPDFGARTEMFKIHLKSRPLDFGINYEELSKLTENFVSSDLEFLCNEAARTALKNKTKITQKLLLEIIQSNKPSVSETEIRKYEQLHKQLEGIIDTKTERKTVGFKQNK